MQHIFEANAHTVTTTQKQSQALKLKVNNVGVAELLFISCYLKQAVVSVQDRREFHISISLIPDPPCNHSD